MTARFSRRGFLLGGVGVLALAACTTEEPEPTPTPSTSEPEPSPSNDLLPAPAAFERSTWSANDAFLGATSFLAVGGTAESRATLASSVNARLFFAGEHTAAVRPGMLTGAWNSGRRAAQEVLGVAEEGDRVIVVGAGLAGATAAADLAAEGYEVIVLEARDRAGGRIGSIADDRWPFPVERGGGFLDTDADAELLEVLLDQGIETVPLFGREVRDDTGRAAEEPLRGSGVVASALAVAEQAPEDVSLLSALGTAIAADPSAVDSASLGAYLRTVIEPRTGAASTALSARNGVRERVDPLELIGDGEQLGRPVAVTGGLENLVRSLLDGLDVRLGSGVAEVDVREDAVGVRLSTGESLSAQRIVVAVPLGVLKARGITFDPELPQAHLDALEQVGVGARETVLLRWEAPFWNTDATLWTVTGTDSHFACWVNLEPATGEPVLVGVAAAGSAEYLAGLGDQRVLDLAVNALLPFRAGPGASSAPSETAEPTEP